MSEKALLSNKLHQDIQNYSHDMSSNSDGKVKFFSERIEKLIQEKGRTLYIADVGCCSGELTEKIKKKYRDYVEIVGIDLSNKMISLAKNKYPGINFIVGNGYNIPFSRDSFDLILMSSIVHEFGSYYDQAGDMKSYNLGIATAIFNSVKKLKKGGKILIKDPVLPMNSDKTVILHYKKLQNFNKKSETNISKMTYPERVSLFLYNFPWIKNENMCNSLLTKKLSLGLVNEISRHTSNAICNSWEHFYDELNEWYGSWNKKEWEKYISQVEDIVHFSHEASFSTKNHSTSFYEYFDIFDENGIKVNPQQEIPTHQFTVLGKSF